MTRSLRIGEVADEAGVNIQTLRYYERRGLVVAPFRRHSGQREYPEAAVARVRVIKAAQRLGFTLAEIEELFNLAAHRRGTGEIRQRAAAKIREIDDRIGRLRAMKAELRELLATECDSLTDCSCGLGYALPFESIGRLALGSFAATGAKLIEVGDLTERVAALEAAARRPTLDDDPFVD